MPRYDEMDALLRGVRERLGAKPEPGPVATPGVHGMPPEEDTYTGIVEAVMVLLRDMQQLRELVTPEQLRSLTAGQREEIVSLLTRIQETLAEYATTIERAFTR